MSQTRPRAVVAGFAVASVAGVVLSVSVATGGSILVARWAILWRLAAWSVAWAVGVVLAFRLPRRFAVPAVFATAVALRLAALAGGPVLSDDVYRYSWDARVQAHRIDPYRYSAQAQALRPLREPWLWPGPAGCHRLHRPPGCTLINRPSAPTIYPPLAEAWFTTAYRLGGIGARHKLWQVAGFVTDVALVGLLPVALRAWGRDQRWVALYALSPVAVVEVVNNGHVDGLAALLIVLGLIIAARNRPGWAGAALGAAGLVKLYPLLVVLALAAVGLRRSRSLGKAAAGAAAVFAIGYAPHVAAVGSRVLGYLPGYLREEDYAGGGRYLLAGLPGAPAAVAPVMAVVALGAACIWVLVRRPDPPRGSAPLLGVLLLVATPVQPWYAVTLLAAATVAARAAWMPVAVAAYPYFFAVILDARHRVGIGRASYAVALAAVCVASWAGTTITRRAGPEAISSLLRRGGPRREEGLP